MGKIEYKSKLDYSNSGLTEFPEDIFKFKNVKKLILRGNKIKNIPAEIATLKSLKVLDLSNNNIVNLKAKFFDLVNLEVLILSNNEIKTIPKQVAQLVKLKKLHISKNRLSRIPAEIGGLISLQELNISQNPFTEFPVEVLRLSNIESLYFTKIMFNSIPLDDIAKSLTKLKKIYSFNPVIDSDKFEDKHTHVFNNSKGNSIKLMNLMKGKNLEKQPADRLAKPIKNIFISYSHRDKIYKENIVQYLSALSFTGVTFSFWVDDQIESGDKFESEINKAMAKADIVIFIISINFMSSKFIQEKELPTFLEKAEQEGTRFLIIIARECPYENSVLGKYQAVNTPKTPLNSLSEAEQDAIYTKLYKDVAKYV